MNETEKLVEAVIDAVYADAFGCDGDHPPDVCEKEKAIREAVAALLSHVNGLKASYETLEQVRQDKYEQLRRELDRHQQELADLRAENERLKALFDNEAAITVNVLRKWPREQIVRFAEHLLGEKEGA